MYKQVLFLRCDFVLFITIEGVLLSSTINGALAAKVLLYACDHSLPNFATTYYFSKGVDT